jgi:hypothetical protein
LPVVLVQLLLLLLVLVLRKSKGDDAIPRSADRDKRVRGPPKTDR